MPGLLQGGTSARQAHGVVWYLSQAEMLEGGRGAGQQSPQPGPSPASSKTTSAGTLPRGGGHLSRTPGPGIPWAWEQAGHTAPFPRLSPGAKVAASEASGGGRESAGGGAGGGQGQRAGPARPLPSADP